MACYLFTFHSYGTWMPDHEKGYVHRNGDLRSKDAYMAERYRSHQRHPKAYLSKKQQEAVIEELLRSATCQNFTIRAIATDATHIHLLIDSQHGQSEIKNLQRRIKSSITRRLNVAEKRKWLSSKASCRSVLNDSHFDYLVNDYLREHRGVKYDERWGIHQ